MPPSSPPYRLATLPTGARVVSTELADRPSITMAIMFKVGSRYESEREAGISHFLEHMFFKGSARYGGAKEIAEAIEGVGGVLNAATDKELTMYWARVPKTKAKLAIDVLGDMLFQPLLDTGELEKERLVVLEELRMYQDSPQEYVHSLFEQISWPNHPLGRDVGGTEGSVRALTRDDLLRYLDEHYLLRNLVVTIAGPVTHDEAIGLIAPYLKPRGNGAPPPAFLPSVGNGLKPNVLLKSKKTEQAHVVLGVHAPSYMDRDRHVIDMLNCVLGEGMSSRLFLEVRERLGLAYDVHSYVNKMYDSGVLGIYAGTEPRQAARAVGAIVGQLRRLCEEPVSAAELTKAKEFYKGRLLLQMESTNSVATWYGGQEALTGRIEDTDQTVAEIDAVTADDIRRVARQLFNQALQLAVIGPFRSEAPFLKQIA
ncbi:MAG: insulinase family protein [Chloroflexi bacterium]|nr:MAG: insulinase family protein [Chloroflexota bacterium]TMD64604.1 MAG: insulinase family protein [Chloroflexota bacterium]